MEFEKYADAYTYLKGAVRGMLGPKLGKDDARYDKGYESYLVSCFEQAIHYDNCQRFFLVSKDKLYTYNGRFYQTDGYGLDMLMAIVKRALHDIGVGYMYEQAAYRKIATNCLDAMRFEKDSQFIPDRRYIIFKNCVLDTVSRNVYNFDMRFRTDIVLDFEYSDKSSLLWDRVIAQTIPNVEMREAFQSFCGAFLTNRRDYSIEYVCYLIGRGRNGKSVVTGAIANMFGERLVSNYSPQELFRDTDKKYNRAGLVGKIANFSDDVSTSDFAGGMFKQFVSGHKISARNPYGRPFDLTEIPFMCCCVNELPPTSDNSLGHNRRILPITCPNKIDEREADPQLASKLAVDEVKIGIFNWILKGLWRLRDNNGRIILGESVKEAQRCATAETSTVYAWISECNINKPDYEPKNNDKNWRSVSEWYKIYLEWCAMLHETPKKSAAMWKAFRDLDFPTRRDKKNVYYCATYGEAEESVTPTTDEELKAARADAKVELPF
jgi:putative DNA primase/helicase